MSRDYEIPELVGKAHRKLTKLILPWLRNWEQLFMDPILNLLTSHKDTAWLVLSIPSLVLQAEPRISKSMDGVTPLVEAPIHLAFQALNLYTTVALSIPY